MAELLLGLIAGTAFGYAIARRRAAQDAAALAARPGEHTDYGRTGRPRGPAPEPAGETEA